MNQLKAEDQDEYLRGQENLGVQQLLAASTQRIAGLSMNTDGVWAGPDPGAATAGDIGRLH